MASRADAVPLSASVVHLRPVAEADARLDGLVDALRRAWQRVPKSVLLQWKGRYAELVERFPEALVCPFACGGNSSELRIASPKAMRGPRPRTRPRPRDWRPASRISLDRAARERLLAFLCERHGFEPILLGQQLALADAFGVPRGVPDNILKYAGLGPVDWERIAGFSPPRMWRHVTSLDVPVDFEHFRKRLRRALINFFSRRKARLSRTAAISRPSVDHAVRSLAAHLFVEHVRTTPNYPNRSTPLPSRLLRPATLGEPPFAGTENIEPIRLWSELRREAETLRNGVDEWVDDIFSGGAYVYRVREPQRATFSVEFKDAPGGPVEPTIARVVGADGAAGDPACMDALREWLDARRNEQQPAVDCCADGPPDSLPDPGPQEAA